MRAEHVDLLARVVRGEQEAAAATMGHPDFDATAFGAFAERHRVAGMLWPALEHPVLAAVAPPALRERCRTFYLRQWTKNERLVREAARLQPGLTAAAPDHLFMKGPFLAVRFHGDIDRRAISDLDVLVPEGPAIAGVDALLRADGYHRTSLGGPRSALARRFAHHLTYRRDDLAVEVHWAFQRHFSFRIDYDAVRAARREVVVRGRTFAVTSDEDELVLQLLAVFTDAQLGTFRAATLIDVYAILRAVAATIDWERFLAMRTRQGLGRIAVTVLGVTLDLLGCAHEFPSLVAALARRGAERRLHTPAEALAFLDARRFDMMAKMKALTLHEAPLPLCVVAWAASLPVRIAVHRDDALAGIRELRE